jgi:hypothetical protein
VSLSLGRLETAQLEDASHKDRNLTNGKIPTARFYNHLFLIEISRSSDCYTPHLAELSGSYFEPFCSLNRATSILSGAADAAFGQAIRTSR